MSAGGQRRTAIMVVDLGFGDAGKGTTIDALARRHEAKLVVRFNGGPQAGHNVVLPDGRHHTFSQFGSHLFVDGTRTLLAEPMLIEPHAMIAEAAHLESIGVRGSIERLAIDRRCKVISPVQQAANQLRELARGSAAHGTCGRGVGECMSDAIEHPSLKITAGDLADRVRVRAKLLKQLELKRDLASNADSASSTASARVAEALAIFRDTRWVDTVLHSYQRVAHEAAIVETDAAVEFIRGEGIVLFEGAQGVLLDEDAGFHPHTTWSRTTFANAEAILDEAAFDGDRIRWGVTRCYQTRHGAGPLPSAWSDDVAIDEPHNNATGWQGHFRAGHFDAVLMDYALQSAGPLDGIVITHLDRLPHLPPGICVAHRVSDGRTIDRKHPLPRIDKNDFAARAALTDSLKTCKPIIESPLETDDFVAWFKSRFATNVPLTSHGPTWSDKRWSER